MKKTERQLVNPFSEAFWPTWLLWRDFRKEEHGFSYKGVISEQMAIKRLVEVSEGDEDKAKRIVEQSISRGWMDFYKLKQPSNNGKSAAKAKSGSGNNQPEQSITDKFKEAFKRNNGGGEQKGTGDHLKAV
jgi:hypothetical protein